ncbi:MAG: hypothetical protein MOP51_1306 [Citricoccus sp.]|nr:hypothetical protein [Citricoccus sp. WCRC_4]
MSLSRSPMWTQRAGSPNSSVVRRMLSSHRTLSFPSIGTRVGLIRLFRALVPLNVLRVQNLTAPRPSGRPSVVTARLECISSPQAVCIRTRPHRSLPP